MSEMPAFRAGELELPRYAYAFCDASWFSSPYVSWLCDSPLFLLSLKRVQPTNKCKQFQNGAPTNCGLNTTTTATAKSAIPTPIKMKWRSSSSITPPNGP
jgi:hypothetical protein